MSLLGRSWTCCTMWVRNNHQCHSGLSHEPLLMRDLAIKLSTLRPAGSNGSTIQQAASQSLEEPFSSVELLCLAPRCGHWCKAVAGMLPQLC